MLSNLLALLFLLKLTNTVVALYRFLMMMVIMTNKTSKIKAQAKFS